MWVLEPVPSMGLPSAVVLQVVALNVGCDFGARPSVGSWKPVFSGITSPQLAGLRVEVCQEAHRPPSKCRKSFQAGERQVMSRQLLSAGLQMQVLIKAAGADPQSAAVSGPKRPHKHKDPTKHDCLVSPHFGPWNRDLRSLCL